MGRGTMTYQDCSLKGVGDLNEDCLVINHHQNIYGVIDGATSVTSFRNEQGHTGGYIAANLLQDFFQSVQTDKPLSHVVIEANEVLRKTMLEYGIVVSNKANLWCAAFAIFRIHDHCIEYVQAGDCMLIVKYNDATIRHITRDQLAHLDALSLQKLREAKRRGYTDQEEINRFVLPTIRDNRLKSNTLDGYAVMNGEPEFALFLEYGWFNRMTLSAIYALTDGMLHPTQHPPSQGNWNKTVISIDDMGLQAYAESMIKIEEADPLCEQYWRHKVSDDKTGVVISFHHR